MIKLCQFPAVDSRGNQLIELFHHPDQLHHSHMDKVAAPFLPEIREYIDNLHPDPNCIYALVNALGAYEYWSSNINGDAFEEEHVIHRGPIWGYETFVHYARPFMHHANKGPNARAFGSVELSCWNPRMHRVELIVKLDRAMAYKVNAQGVIDKIDQGQLPDTSMGCKVPYDLCSITTDWELYRKALATFNPKKHRHPGIAALIYHKTVQPVRGLSITRDDYSDYAKFRMNEILPDGRKVCVFNPFPRFFDISFVFIGAEKQSKMMAKLATIDMGNRTYFVVPSNYVADQHGMVDPWEQPDVRKDMGEKVASWTSNCMCRDPLRASGCSAATCPRLGEKTAGMKKIASIEKARQMLREFKKKASQQKRAEIIKDIVPSQFGGKAVPVLEDSEPDLPKETLDHMGSCPLSESLSTPTMMGITLKPREFQRIIICRIKGPEHADALEDGGKIFRPVEDVDKSIDMGPEHVSRMLASLLKPAIEGRSILGPVLTRRMIKITLNGKPQGEQHEPMEELEDKLLDKISAAYNGYREQVIEKIASMTPVLQQFPDVQAAIFDVGLEDVFVGEKVAAGMDPKLLLGAIPATYLLSALARRKVRRDVQRGETPGMLTDLLAEHPHLAATGVGLAALKASGSQLPDQILKGAIGLGKRVVGLG